MPKQRYIADLAAAEAERQFLGIAFASHAFETASHRNQPDQ
jgi:hypothetical protein